MKGIIKRFEKEIKKDRIVLEMVEKIEEKLKKGELMSNVEMRPRMGFKKYW